MAYAQKKYQDVGRQLKIHPEPGVLSQRPYLPETWDKALTTAHVIAIFKQRNRQAGGASSHACAFGSMRSVIGF
jgi:hypothetical protein